MHKFLIIKLLLLVNCLIAQDVDTTFSIKTESSTIRLMYKKTKIENGGYSTARSLVLMYVVSEKVIKEAVRKNIEKDQLVARLIFNDGCELVKMELTKPGALESFNTEFLSCFQEFKKAFDENDLSKYFKPDDEFETCFFDRLVVKFYLN